VYGSNILYENSGLLGCGTYRFTISYH